MPPNSGVRRSQSNNNNLKTLRANFKQSISTLHELFPEWTQDDLSFVMDECQGDIDLAITRITEGYANQWDQVKSKKPKPTQTHQKKTFKNNKDAVRVNNKTKTSGKTQKTKKNKEKNEQKKEIAQPPEEEQKPSWASILRGPPKLEESAHQATTKSEVEEVLVDAKKETIEIVHIEEKETDISEDLVITQTEVVVEETDFVKQFDEEDELKEQEKESKEQEKETEEEDTVEESTLVESEITEEETASVSPPLITTIRKPTVRRLNQLEAVVLPGNQQPTSLATVNVQFGSLNLSNGEEQEVKDENEIAVEETVIIEPKVENPQTTVEKQEEKKEPETPVVETVNEVKSLPTPPETNLATINSGKPLPQPFQPQQLPAQPVLLQQPPTQQILSQQTYPAHSYPQVAQPPPQQHNESYAYNPYASYTPNLHNTISGYSISAPNIIYNGEPQRVNYYDPALYGQSPSLNTAVPHIVREKYNAGAPVYTHPIPQQQQIQPQPQQQQTHQPHQQQPQQIQQQPQQQAQIHHQQPQQQAYISNGVPYYSYYYTQQQQTQQPQQYNGYQPQAQIQTTTGYQPPKTMYHPSYNNNLKSSYASYNENMLQHPSGFDSYPQQNEIMHNKEQPMYNQPAPHYIYNYNQVPPQHYSQQQRQPYWH